MPGLSFLNLKPWHPSNKINQKRIWIAEQKAKDRHKQETEAALEILKEQDIESMEHALHLGRDEKERSLRFMYRAPPGILQAAAAEDEAQDLTEDDAVRMFRQRIHLKRDPNFSATAEQSKLEKTLGRRENAGLTLDEQTERFPFLKGAPVEGDYAKNVKLTFKPLGKAMLNVRCMRCGEWGHKSGDRECALVNFNPHDQARQRREDPMTYMKTQLVQDKQKLILKKSALPPEMIGLQPGEGEHLQLLLSDEDDDEDPEATFLASLSTKEKKLLLRKIQELETKTGCDDIIAELSQLDADEIHLMLAQFNTSAHTHSSTEIDAAAPAEEHSERTKTSRKSKHQHSSSSKKRRRHRKQDTSSSESGSSSSSSEDEGHS